MSGAAGPQEVVAAIVRALGGRQRAALHQPEFAGNEWAYVKECLDTGWVSSVGAFVDRFERDLAAFTGSPFAVVTVNGTAALHVALLLAGVVPGDEVLIPSITFVATANAVAYCGAVPHFADSEERTLGIDAARLAAHLAEIADVAGGVCRNRITGRPIRALVPMHVFGHPCEMAALRAVCAAVGLALVEDAAEALGSTCGGRHVGTDGNLATLSFNGNKVLTTGGGGAILTGDPDLARRAKHLTTTAKQPHRWEFIHDEVGFNYRLPNLNAALGCAQLEALPGMLARKRALAGRYAEAFVGVPGVTVLAEPPGCRSNFWLNTLVLAADGAARRDEILAATNDLGLQTRPVWTPMHRLGMYRDCPRMDLATAEALAGRLISLPSSACLA
ncbi:MAG: LegC family aminotransferase [Planctomycetes bacterium]|nr:LegC family aminotransferase [Planctomycetota bacterium]